MDDLNEKFCIGLAMNRRHFNQGALAAAAFTAALTDTQALANTMTQPTSSKGSLIIQGGAVHPETADIWQAIVADAGGPGAVIAVMPQAAANPQSSGLRIVETLARYGAKGFIVPAAPRWPGGKHREAAQNPELAAQVAAAGGIFFTGGDQGNITDTLLAPDGSATPLLKACHAVLAKGGVIAGTSAGAAIMSEWMFYEPGEVLDLLNHGMKAGRDHAKGLGFIGPGVFVDQHLLARGRFARMLPLMRQLKIPFGYGVDENTALRVDLSKGTGTVLGASGVLIVDLRQEDASLPLAPYRAKGVRLGLLDKNDTVDLRSAAITPSAFKQAGRMLLPHATDYKPEFRERKFYPDVLGDSVLPKLLVNFVDNRQTEVRGLAFAEPGTRRAKADASSGFEFVFRKGADTRAWLRIDQGKAHYTVADVELDVLPVAMASPLFGAR